METRTDNKECDFCDKNLNGRGYEETHTKSGLDFCCYECAENFFGSEWLDSDDDFISVQN